MQESIYKDKLLIFIRDEEDRYGYDAGERKEEAVIADQQVDNNQSHKAKYFLEI